MSAFVFQSSQVQSIATQIETLGTEIRNILDTELTNEMSELQQVWKSNAATAYNTQFQNIKAEFTHFYEAITYMSQSINDVAAALNQTDNANNVM